jgi:hypothetical protein
MKITDLETGLRATCKIDGEEITDSKLYVDLEDKSIYICQDIQAGAKSPKRLGYKNSWIVRCKPDSDELDFEHYKITDFKIVKEEECLFKYGERIFIRDDENEEWEKVIFLAYLPGAHFPYICVQSLCLDAFEEGRKYSIDTYKYARKKEEKSPFEYGEKILVRDASDEGWRERIFIACARGARYPYMCVTYPTIEKFNNGEEYATVNYRYAKKIKE